MTVHSISYTNRGSIDRWNVDQSQYQRIENNSIIETRPFTPQDQALVDLISGAVLADATNFLTRVGVALSANNNYTSKVQAGTATNADAIQQVAALTRQVQALIIFTVFDVDSD
jgi:hypothetical protein